MGQAVTAMGHQFGRQVVGGDKPRFQLDDAPNFLAPFGFGTPTVALSWTAGCSSSTSSTSLG